MAHVRPAARASSIAPHHAARLGARLLVLVVGLGVGDGAAAGLHVRDAVLDDDGADADAGVEVARVGEVADRAAVGAALDRLELVDDLHRADLRGARQRARRQHGAQRVDRADVRAQRPGDVGDDVHDVRVGLDRHEALDLRRCRTRTRGRGRCGRGRRASRARRAPSRRRAARRRSRRRPRRRAARAGAGDRARGDVAAGRRSRSGSGEAPTIWKSSKSRKYMYGDGLTARRPR